MRKTVPLNDGWLFAPGFEQSWLDPMFDFGMFYPVALPHNVVVSDNAYDLPTVYTYTRLIAPDEKYNGSKLELCFGGVMSYAEVYINGMFVTSHKGDTPFTVDVSAPIKIGFENRIVVKTDGRIKKDVPLTTGIAPLPVCSGIYRGVTLKITGGGEIADAFVKTEVGEDSCGVSIDVTLGDFYPDSELSAKIVDLKGIEVGSLAAKTVLGKEVTLVGSLTGVSLWSVDSPTLYTARITLKCGNRLMDVKEEVFGFRSAVFKRDGFYLNGEKLKLVGLNRLDSFPVIGRAVTPALQRYDARKLKELGCNVVRTHGLHDKSFIEECDRIGLLVIEGMGGDGYIGGSSWREALVKDIEEIVRRDRNSPCVIAWGVRVNNSADCDELYFKTGKAARDCDPTRATLGSRSFMSSRLYEDVFGFNDYNKKHVVSALRGTSALFVPYFISEHTGKLLPTKRYSDEGRKRLQATRHMQTVNTVLGHKSICGCAGMAYADFECGAALGDKIKNYGVLDEYRLYKQAGYAYRAQTDYEPVLYTSGFPCGDESGFGFTVYTNCDSVKLYRDGNFVGEYAPDRKKYANLKHPPIEITDFIGMLPQVTDNMTPRQTKMLKYVVGWVKEKGGLFGLSFIGKALAFVLRRSLKADKAAFIKLVNKYAFAPAAYSLEGMKGGETAIKRQITPTDKNVQIRLKASDTELHPGESYETTLVTAELLDSAGNPLSDEFSPIRIIVEGELRLMGSDVMSLVGGSAGFFLVTTPYDGKARVSVVTRYGQESIELEVTHERVEEL